MARWLSITAKSAIALGEPQGDALHPAYDMIIPGGAVPRQGPTEESYEGGQQESAPAVASGIFGQRAPSGLGPPGHQELDAMRGSLSQQAAPPMVVRMVIDALSIMFSLLLAFIAMLLWTSLSAAQQPGEGTDIPVEALLHLFVANAPLLTLLSLAVFYSAGFYTYGRHYQGRHRTLTIAAAVLASFVIYAGLVHFAWDQLGISALPWPMLSIAAAIAVVVILAERGWPWVWDRVLRPERESHLRQSLVPGCRILVTGGAGYIGSALVAKLLRSGYRVRVLDRLVYGREAIQPLLDHPHFELVEGDVRHVDHVVNAMHDVHAVIHLAAIVGDPACEVDRDVTIDVNLLATQHIAEVAKANGIQRFIFASTCSVYGANDRLLDETSETRPVSLYGRTKLAAERGLRLMMDETFQPTILRFSTIYGLSGRTRFDLVVNLLAVKATMDGVITIQGGNQWRPFLHVDDAALAILLALQADPMQVGGETFSVGSNEQNHTIEQIGQMVHRLVPKAKLLIDDKITDKRNYRVSFWKIRHRLGFVPQWTLEQGIRQVVDAVARGAVVDYRDPIYSNQKFLSEPGAIEAIRESDDWSVYLSPGHDEATAGSEPAAARVLRMEPQVAG
jgi:nucleoside-diphosphate-sugar epimerase